MASRRYDFDNPLPALPDTITPPAVVHQPYPLAPAAYEPGAGAGQVMVQHFHQAPPDRTVARVALGAGMGGGAIAAGVYFGPLLVAALASIAASLATVALVAVAAGWAVVHVVRTVDGHTDAKAARKQIGRR